MNGCNYRRKHLAALITEHCYGIYYRPTPYKQNQNRPICRIGKYSGNAHMVGFNI